MDIKHTVCGDGNYGEPVYHADGSGLHVDWCPCYGCHCERTNPHSDRCGECGEFYGDWGCVTPGCPGDHRDACTEDLRN